MKTITASLGVSLVLLAASAVSSFAQDEIAYAEPAAAQVVYQAPVIYRAPVVYQATVAYYAPVYYVTAAACPQACAPAPRCVERPAASTVVVMGGRGGTYSYSNDRCTSPSVIYFGSGQRQVVRRARY